MRLAPINNPHATIGQEKKKTKQEEQEEFLENTKNQVIDKYKEKRSLSNRFNQHKKNMTGSGTTFKKKDDFKLEEKVTAKSECIRLM